MKQIADMNMEEMLAAYSDNSPCVYLIGNTNFWFCKIGKDYSPWHRLSALDSPKLPFTLEVMAFLKVDTQAESSWIERKLHKHFEAQRLRGEWFDAISPRAFMRAAKDMHKAYLRGV